MMNIGTARICAGLMRPPRTANAAITTKFPVICAVNRLPSVKKPVRSTMPAITLSSGGRRPSNRDSTSSADWRRREEAPGSTMGILEHLAIERLGRRHSSAERINQQLGHNQSDAHGENNEKSR